MTIFAILAGIALVILSVGVSIYLCSKATQIAQLTEIERVKFNNDVRIFNAKKREEQLHREA